VCRWCNYCTFLPAENVAFQPLLLCNASVMNLINISPLEAVSVIRGAVPDVKPLFGCRRNPLVVAPS
jgi:succinate dehydrogenase/fumarate reductase-like Fe-S protein